MVVLLAIHGNAKYSSGKLSIKSVSWMIGWQLSSMKHKKVFKIKLQSSTTSRCENYSPLDTQTHSTKSYLRASSEHNFFRGLHKTARKSFEFMHSSSIRIYCSNKLPFYSYNRISIRWRDMQAFVNNGSEQETQTVRGRERETDCMRVIEPAGFKLYLVDKLFHEHGSHIMGYSWISVFISNRIIDLAGGELQVMQKFLIGAERRGEINIRRLYWQHRLKCMKQVLGPGFWKMARPLHTILSRRKSKHGLLGLWALYASKAIRRCQTW